MDPLITQSLFFGALGGLVRALIGIGKYTDFLEGLYKIKKAQGFEI
jgi:hypothetical protein